jgi:hypothetical protein
MFGFVEVPAMPAAPFPTAEAAWLWAASALMARHDPAAPVPPPGPCRVEDVVKCLDTLYRARALELLHARILRIWGWRGMAPNPARPRERCDWRLRREAMEAMDAPLRARGIVAGPRCAMPAAAFAGLDAG